MPSLPGLASPDVLSESTPAASQDLLLFPLPLLGQEILGQGEGNLGA